MGCSRRAWPGWCCSARRAPATRPRSPAAFAVLLLPYSLIGPFAGVLLDRWRRQRVLLWSNVLRCLLVGVVAIEIATRVEGVPFYATALLVTSVNRFFLAAQSAAQPHVVEPEQLVTGNALSTTSGSVATAVGLGVAVLLRQVVGNGDGGYALIALTSILGYGSSAFLARRFGPDQLGPDDVRRSPPGDRCPMSPAGWSPGRGTWPSDARCASALAAIGAHRFFYGISTISILLLYRNYFTDEGFFQAGLAGLGQVFAARRGRRAHRGRHHPGRGPPDRRSGLARPGCSRWPR